MNDNTNKGKLFSTNVSVTERITSVAAGALLVLDGLRYRNKLTIPKAVAGGYLIFRGATGYCPAYQLAGKSKLPDPAKNINIKTILFVNRPRLEVYNFWRNLSNLPLFMGHIKSVKNIDGKLSKWKAWLPGYVGVVKWKAEIVKDEQGKLLGWNSLPGSLVGNAGKIEFRDAEGGTELRVLITYHAPLGVLGAGIAKLLSPTFQSIIEEDVKNFKRYIETGARPEKKKASIH